MSVAIITGASSGIGREFAKQIKEKLAVDNFWFIARNAGRMEKLRDELGVNAKIISADLATSEGIETVRRALEEEKPELIQVWGTEFTHGLCALRQAKGIPSVVYMQGFLGSIARYYLAGIEEKELKKCVTFRDFVKRDSILEQQKKYYRSAKKEPHRPKQAFLQLSA